MKVYHYTSFENWENIKNGSWKSDNKPGLGASRRVGFVNDDARRIQAVFALFEPVPKNWMHNAKFPDIWLHLKRDTGRMLLEIQVDENDQNVFVIDRGEMEKFLFDDHSDSSEIEKHTQRVTAEGKYIASKVPLAEYLKNYQQHQYVLPEIIFTEDVPMERIAVSAEQPLMQELLDEISGNYRNLIIKKIQEIPELKAWYDTKYFTREVERTSLEMGRKLR